eukprot:CAMPEP_0179905522 /NCGR_PEP_ID=MMETSP0982-20121206/42649_1 /TAXON_ID=483367 /ORGANISM="non described non described, Strain CCMP 2436" /LENGTH=39 /DNA_ID= /DNA_START= /DNA_END= /DNA_ORIENTATION=
MELILSSEESTMLTFAIFKTAVAMSPAECASAVDGVITS